MTYTVKMIYGKKCIVENETQYFVILNEIKSHAFAYNYNVSQEHNSPDNSRNALLRILEWIKNNHPESML